MNPANQYFLKQQEPFKSILLEVKVLIEYKLPNPDLQFKWKLPIYYSDSCPICYINVTRGYVDLCFWIRDNFNVHLDKLISENRKFVKSLRYFRPEDINGDVIIDCINEAYRTRGRKFTVENLNDI